MKTIEELKKFIENEMDLCLKHEEERKSHRGATYTEHPTTRRIRKILNFINQEEPKQ